VPLHVLKKIQDYQHHGKELEKRIYLRNGQFCWLLELGKAQVNSSSQVLAQMLLLIV
jgi:hypothetical protein